MSKQTNKNFSTGDRVALFVFVVTLALYFLNIILGKASIHWGWDVFYLGSINEFLLLLATSISFVVLALHREAKADNKNQ
jgi:hypothetical protein